MTHPINLLNTWLEEEKQAGSELADHAVLSTQGLDGNPQGRVVAIREVNQEWILLFTQKRSRKAEEIKHCSKVALTFWFERYAREVMIEGEALFLSESQIKPYWDSNPKNAHIQFYSYSETSGLPIDNKRDLENKRLQIAASFQNEDTLPLSPEYCGIAVRPRRFVFYTFRLDELSDVWEYLKQENAFIQRTLSP